MNGQRGIIYPQNYIPKDEANRLVEEIDAVPWRTDLNRRVQNYGYRYDYKTRQARREDRFGPLPELFQQLAERLTAEGYFQTVPDLVIVNEHQRGQGIFAHIDHQPRFGETIASLSLCDAVCFPDPFWANRAPPPICEPAGFEW